MDLQIQLHLKLNILLNWLGHLFEFKYDKLKEINFILTVIFYITIVNTEFMVL